MINKKKKTGMYILMALITVLVVFPFIYFCMCHIFGYRISNYIFQLFCNFKNGIQK